MTNEANDQVRLGTLLRSRGKLDADVVVELGVRLAEALAAAEKQGIGSSPIGGRVPLTPDSFVVHSDGSVTLQPGRSLGRDDRQGFRTWAAPEQLRGETAELPAWMFSVGAILYEAATGDALFEAASPPAANSLVTEDLNSHLIMAAVTGRMRATRAGLETLTRSCLDPDPNRRPDNPAILRVLLEELEEDAPTDSLAAVATEIITEIDAAQNATPGFLTGTDSVETLPGFEGSVADSGGPTLADPVTPTSAADGAPPPAGGDPLTSANAEEFWNSFGTGDGAPGDDEQLPGGSFAPTDSSFEPEADPMGDGVGGQSFEIELEARPARPEPTDPPSTPPADTSGPRDSGEISVADRSIDRSSEHIDHELRTARVRPIREIPPAVTTNFRRLVKLVVGLLVLFLLLLATIWLQLMPELPTAITDPIESTVAPLAAPLPAGVRSWAANSWDSRSSHDRAGRFWNGFVDLLPSEMQRQLRPPPAREAHLDWPGAPTGEGIIGAVSPALSPEPGLPDSSGRLELALAYAGSARPLGGPITWSAEPVPDPRGPELAKDIERLEGPDGISTAKDRTAKSGEGHDAFILPAGFWDVSVTYGESDLAGGWTGAARGVRVSPGYSTILAGGVEVPAGRLTPRVLLDGQEHTEHLTVALFDAKAAAAIQSAEKAAEAATIADGEEPRQTATPPPVEGAAPLWAGPIAGVPALAEGVVTARLAFDDSVHWPSVTWFEDVAIPGAMATATPTWKLERDEPLHPTGPGVRIAAANFARDVSRKTQVFLYRSEDNVLHAAAVATGRAGRYFDVPPGEYNLRLVYQPMGPKSSLFAERVIASFVVAAEGVTEETVDLGYPMAWMDLQVMHGDEDVSKEVDLVVLREGVDRDAGTRTLDEEGVGQHALPADTYDIYIAYKPRDDRDPVDVVFSGVKLEAGERWVQRWQIARLPWSAAPPE